MIILEDILSQEIVQKLGWTLLHFIWQAAVVALLVAILLKVLRKSAANLRYIIACLALVLIVLLPVITIQLIPVSAPHMATYIEPAPAPAVLSIEEMPAAETIIVEEPEQHESVTPISADSWTQRAVGALEPALPYLVSGWLIGVFALSLWHLGGWTQLQRLKRRMVKQVDDTLSSKLKVLAQRLRVKQTVQLMESALVQIPTVVGWLRPVILLPASALTGLSSEQLEAILAHELAHIKRFDYLVNILQTVVEILGFYHPAVWWVSHKIRAERENCCDDLAVNISGDRVCYARALTSMEEIRAGHGQLAVAAAGGNLSRRIRRLVSKDSTEKTSFSWIPAATAILLIAALLIPTVLALTTHNGTEHTAESLLDKMLEHRSKVKNVQFVAEYDIWHAGYSEEYVENIRKSMRERGIPEQQLQRMTRGFSRVPQSRYQILKCTIDNEERAKIERTTGTYDSSGKKLPSGDKNISAWNGVLGINFNQRRGFPGSATFKDTPPTGASRQGHPWKTFTGNFCRQLAEAIKTEKQIRVDESKDGTYRVVFDNDPIIKIAVIYPSQGYSCILNENYNKEKLAYRSTAKYKEVAKGIWFPVSGQTESYAPDGSLSSKSTIETSQIIINDPAFNESFFDVDLPEGTEVRDTVQGKHYVVGSKNVYELPESQKSVTTKPEDTTDGTEAEMPPEIDPNAWQKAFYAVYRLKDGEILKRIAPPFIPERRGYFLLIQPGRYSPNTPHHVARLYFNWDGKLSIRGSSVGGGIPRLNSILESVIGLGNFEYDIPSELLQIDMSGDWIVRKDTPTEALMKAIKEIVKNETAREIDFVKQKVETEVIIAQGKYDLKPLPGVKEGNYILISTAKTDAYSRGGGGSGTVSRFLRWVGNRINMYIIDETESEDIKIYWRNHDSSNLGRLSHNKKLYNERLDMLLSNLTRQTGLTFERKTAAVEKWFISKEEPSADSIPAILPTIAKSPTPSAKDEAHVQVDCLIVEVSLDSKMDRETTIIAENLLGNKISLRDTKVDVLLRKAVDAMAATKDKSAENKRVTQDQFKALTKMLTSRGYMRILMNPIIQVVDGKTAKIKSTHSSLQESSLQITPHVPEDGHIIHLQVEAVISSQFIPQGKEQTPIISKREISTLAHVSPGESMIIGGIKRTEKSNVKDSKEQTKEVLFIITPTIIKTDNDSEKKPESAHKLKLLGLAVAMYADDHDKQLPDTLEPLKPYIANEQDYLWLLDNAEYVLKETKYHPNQPHLPVAYDKTQKDKQSGANVLFMDGHVAFLTPQKINELDIRRADILIETWFLAVNKDFIENINHNADSPDEAKELFKLKSELLAAVDGSETQSFILDEHNVSLLLKAVQAHKDSKMLAAPQIICREGKTAKIEVMNKETYYITGYTEPNTPSDKPQPKFDKIEEGIALSLRPNLAPNKNIYMQFEFKITQALDSEERQFMGKAPYKPPRVQRHIQSSYYRVQNGETLLFGGHKIADQQDGRTEQKDLLVLIKAQTVDSSEQHMPAQAELPAVVEPTSTTSKVIIPPATTQSRRVRSKDNEQEKTKSATEQKPQMIQKIFPLQHHDASKMAQILKPLLSHTGHISADERTNNLLVIDTAENLMRIEKIIAAFDVSVAKQAVQKSFKLKYRSPSQMAQILRPLLTKTGHVSADESTGILLLIDTPENLKRIEKIIAAFDVLQAEQTVQKFFKLKYYSLSQMAQILMPLLTKTGYISADENTGNLLVIDTVENLKRIELIITEYDVPKADETVTEIFEIRYGDPTEIVELLKKLINGRPGAGAIIEQGKQPIVLVPEPRRKWIIAKGSAEDMKQIGEWIAKLDREEPAPTSLEQIHQQIIKQQKILKMRQDCINNDPVVKALSETVANAEAELIVARQKLADSHPEVRKKTVSLQILKKHLDERIKAAGKSFDDMMLPEPNLPLAPEVPLITNTFIDVDLPEALKDIASMAGIPIIPDETVVGYVTVELKDVPLDTALDIVLAGTPYFVKKTPYYYLVGSAVELLEIQKRVDSAKKLSNLGKALLIYANDHEDKYPDSLHHLSEYLNVEELKWVLANVKYLARGKTVAVRPDTVIAYDKMLPAERKGTNVLFNDCHVDFVRPERLKELGISATAILIDTRLLSVSEDFLKDIGLDANSVSSSDAWLEHLLADSAVEPNSGTYSLLLDELHVSFLLRAIQAHKDARVLSSPQVMCQEGKTAEIAILSEEYYVSSYTEPNDPSDEPETKLDKVELGTRIWLKPELTPDNENVRLDFKLEICQLLGYEERRYKGKYKYIVPRTEVVSTQTQLLVPDGKTLLIGGLKIIEQEKEPRAPRLRDLPLIGGLFSSKDKIKDHKMLLILVKPIINPQQKASKILRGQEDSEEHIKSLARQLEKKLNPPAD